MNTVAPALPTRPAEHGAAMSRAVLRATLAPSIHNSQPWRFTISEDQIDVFADETRQLRVIDPQQRALVISCGAAVFGARTSLAASGLHSAVSLLPEPDNSSHLARITITTERLTRLDAVALDAAADRRHTNRRSLTHEPVPPGVVAALVAAAEAEHAGLRPITDGEERAAVTALVTAAERRLTGDPEYRQELRAWAGRTGRHDDGVPPRSIPAASHVGLVRPGRDFDLWDTGSLHGATRSPGRLCTLLLTTETDDRRAWLEAGQALSHVLLELTRRGLVAALFTQLVEVPDIREGVRRELDLVGYPQVLLDVGHAEPTPATPRRPLGTVLEHRGPRS